MIPASALGALRCRNYSYIIIVPCRDGFHLTGPILLRNLRMILKHKHTHTNTHIHTLRDPGAFFVCRLGTSTHAPFAQPSGKKQILSQIPVCLRRGQR